jgi:hypothetical protein
MVVGTDLECYPGFEIADFAISIRRFARSNTGSQSFSAVVNLLGMPGAWGMLWNKHYGN